jgi:peptidoglycan/LPS O-acetylase OafA/YrhL
MHGDRVQSGTRIPERAKESGQEPTPLPHSADGRSSADGTPRRPMETARPTAGRGYVPALDGMRGLAVSAVMLTHATFGGNRLQGGSIGVDIFFVLSGFLITSILVREYDRGGQINLRRFYARRVLRLGPALAAMLLILSVGGWLLFDAARARSNVTDALITLFYAANWSRAFNLHPPLLLGHAWSLSVEEQFYLIWPIMLIGLLRLVRSRLRIVYLICAGAGLSVLLRVWMAWNGASIERLYNGLDTRADSLLVGCALGMLLASDLIPEDAKRTIASRLRLLAPVSTCVFVGVLLLSSWRSPDLYYWLFVVVEVLVALIILQIFVAERSWAQWFFSRKPLVWIGTISYGLYLWHYPIYALLREDGRGPRAFAGGTVLTFLVAAVSYYAMERPILRLKQRFAAPPAGQ